MLCFDDLEAVLLEEGGYKNTDGWLIIHDQGNQGLFAFTIFASHNSQQGMLAAGQVSPWISTCWGGGKIQGLIIAPQDHEYKRANASHYTPRLFPQSSMCKRELKR